MTKPPKGFLLGKFMPPHRGHVFLCDFARTYCERLTILVCSLPDDPIPGELRFQWMRELFPDCEVRWCPEVLPQEPADHPDFWDIWRDVVARYSDRPDVIFASETYGHRLAQEAGARFVPVDPGRQAVPVSATMIRNAPFAHWEMIPQAVRPWFVRKVCVFGPESTGKSTLAAQLGHHFHTVHVPEYGRIYTDRFGTDIDAETLGHIVSGHRAAVSAAKRQANRILIEDTDPVLTAVWSDMLLDRRDEALSHYDDPAELYLLCDIDVPWVDDGTRYFPRVGDRQRFFDLCRDELEARGLNYVTLSGGWHERFKTAVSAVQSTFRLL